MNDLKGAVHPTTAIQSLYLLTHMLMENWLSAKHFWSFIHTDLNTKGREDELKTGSTGRAIDKGGKKHKDRKWKLKHGTWGLNPNSETHDPNLDHLTHLYYSRRKASLKRAWTILADPAMIFRVLLHLLFHQLVIVAWLSCCYCWLYQKKQKQTRPLGQ